MKIYIQLAILFGVGLVGSLLAAILPFPFPASVAGMILLLLLLALRILKISQIETVGDFLLQNMPLLFIPGCAEILEHAQLLQGVVLQLVFICVATTLLTFVVTIYTVRLVVWLQKKFQRGKSNGTLV